MAATSTPAAGNVGAASSIPITAVKTMSDTTRGLVRLQNWTQTGRCEGTVAFMEPAILLDPSPQPICDALSRRFRSPSMRLRSAPAGHRSITFPRGSTR